MSRPAPFCAAPAQKPYRSGFLRRSLAYMANGDRPPVLAFVWPARALLLHIGSVPSCNVLERSEHVAEWIRLTEEKADVSRQVAAKPPGRPEGGRKAAAREIGVDEKAARRAAKVAGLSERAKDAAETALRASIAACCIVFVACAGWAVTL
ncbi:hypothetical protein [Pseudoroseomonas sp. WGS1072]|uniref:hypothetical protein n=1 Tax=Roseomonas sp. WGS1072 TaxID=3366816 RepID=UPI003BF34446